MFDPTIEHLAMEVEASVKVRDEHLETVRSIIRRYCGPAYRKSDRQEEADPENFAYTYLSNMLPQLGLYNPAAIVDAKRVVGHAAIAQAMTDGLASWIKDMRYARISRLIHADFLFFQGVLLHMIESDRRWSRGTVRPTVRRISPTAFFGDPLAESVELAEYMGHEFWVDYDDLQNDPDVLPDALQKLSPSNDDGYGGKADGAFKKPSGDDVGRKRIRACCVWLRGKNTIRVFAKGQESVELYKETAYFGPDSGPYEVFQAYPVPDEFYPLAPLVAIDEQVKDLNVHTRAAGRAAARRKSMVLVEANNPDLGAKLADAEDGEIVPVKGITGQYAEVQVGGVTAEQIQQTTILRDRLERIGGLTATQQGSVRGAKTATEATIADNSSSLRVEYLQNKVLEHTANSLGKICWYLYHTEGIVIPVNRRDPFTGQVTEGLFLGGPFPTDQGATWEDFDITVKPYSMQRENPALRQQRVTGFLAQFLQLMQMAPMMPWLRVPNIVENLAEAYEFDSVDEWYNPQMMGALPQPPMTPASQMLGPAAPPQQQALGAFRLPGHFLDRFGAAAFADPSAAMMPAAGAGAAPTVPAAAGGLGGFATPRTGFFSGSQLAGAR